MQTVSPFNGQSNIPVNVSLQAILDFDADPTSINDSTVELRSPQGALIPATVTYDALRRTVTLDPNQDLADLADFYQARIVGGPTGVKELNGPELEEDVAWYFITESPIYSDTVILSGLSTPIAVEFANDGRIFVAEKSGIIKVFDDLNDSSPVLFADLRTNVHNHWDRGLLGMALHPDFPNTPELYVLYTYDAPLHDTSLPAGSQDRPPAPYWGTPGVDGDPGPFSTGNGPSVSARLSRLTVGGDNRWDNVEHVLVHDWGQQFPSHSIGDLVFGSDGALYASGGDGASFGSEDYGQFDGLLGSTAFNKPINQGGALRSQDLRSRNLGDPIPDDPVGLNGTIIRIDPSIINGGAPLSDNPLFGDADINAKRIIAYGLRNPFRITAKPGTNEIWSGDVGWNQWEELNVVRDPTDSLVENFGWPAYEGNSRQPGYDGLNLPLLENLYNDPIPSAHVEPFFRYEHGKPVFPGGVQPSGNTSSISGLAFSEGGNLPPAYRDALFISDFSRRGIWVMFAGLDGDPNPASGSAVLIDANDPVQLKIGPAGDLFYVDVGGNIRRIRFEGVDVPPTAIAKANPISGPLDPTLLVNFDGTSSSDQNPDDTLTYRWDLDGDGQLDDSTSPQPGFTYTTPGIVTVTLEVTDRSGLTDIDTIKISVGNTAPKAVIDSPSGSLTWKVGDTINFAGHAEDIDEVAGVLPPSALTWEINVLHCPGGQCHTHFITSMTGINSGSFIAPDHEYPSLLEIKLTATDPVTQFQHTQSVQLSPQTVDLAFNSSPPGLDLTINGVVDTTPFNFTVIAGSNNLISAPSPQGNGGVTYVFSSWSDNGAQNHNVVAGTQSQSLTANFAAAVDTTADRLGTITAQGENAPNETRLKAFDDNVNTKWLDFANANPSSRASWIQYQYANNQRFVVSSYTMTSANDAPERDPKNWTLYGSNDGVTFIPLDTRTNESFSTRFQKRQFTIENGVAYNIYRLNVNSVANPAAANSVQIGEIELIGVPEAISTIPRVTLFAEDSNAAEASPANPGQFKIVRTGSLSNSLTVHYAISGSATPDDYAETLSGIATIPAQSSSVSINITPIDDSKDEGDESLVLTLQSDVSYQIDIPKSGTLTIVDNDGPVAPFDTTDLGGATITAQGENGTAESKQKAFDNNVNTKWLDFANANPSTRASWIQYQYANSQRYALTSYTLTSANDASERDPKDWTLSGSNDGVTFVPLDTRSNQVFSARFQKRQFTITDGAGYNIYRLDIHAVASPTTANSVQLSEIELIGVPATTNRNPIARDDSGAGFVTDENSPFVTANVLANDTDPDSGDTLSLSTFSTAVTLGLVTSNGDGTFAYNPNGRFESLAVGQSAIDKFTYTIVDSKGGSSTATATITISGRNDIPTVSGPIGVINVDEDAVNSSFNLSNVFSDLDLPNDSLTFLVKSNSNPALVDAAISGNQLTLDYLNNQNGSASIIVRATDVAGSFIEDTISLTVRPINDMPSVSSALGAVTVNQDAPASLFDLTTIFTDVDILTNADRLTYLVESNTNPTLVNASITGSQLTLDYLSGQNGIATIVVRATDLAGALTRDTIALTVRPVNHPPTVTASIGVVTAAEDDPSKLIDLSKVFADVDILSGGDVLAYSVESNSNATLVDASVADNLLTLDYLTNANGVATIKVRATDLAGAFATDTISLNVSAVNDAPVRVAGTVANLTLAATAGTTSLGLDALAYTPGGSQDESTQTLAYAVTTVPSATFGSVVLADSSTVVLPGNYSLAALRGMQFRPAINPSGGPGTFRFTITDNGTTAGASDPRTLQESLTININATTAIQPADTTDNLLGTITAQGENAPNETRIKAFDNAASTKWLNFTSVNPDASWIQYEYANDERFVVSTYTMTSANDAPERDPANWSLLGSNDGIDFTVLDTRTEMVFLNRFQKRQFITNNTNAYRIYRLDISSVASPLAANAVQLAEIELFGAREGTPQLPVVSVIATDPSAAESVPPSGGAFVFTRSGSTSGSLNVNYSLVGSSADSSDYSEVLSGVITIPDGSATATLTITPVDDALVEVSETVLLQIATSANYVAFANASATITIFDNDAAVEPFDTTDDGTGTITAQGGNGSFEGKEKAFDNTRVGKWLDFARQNPSTRATWIQYQYASDDQYIVSSYTLTSANDAPERDPKNWVLKGSSDGVNYVTLDTRVDEDFPNRFQTRQFAITNTTPYRIYRLEIQSVADPLTANSMQLAEIELIGVPGSTTAAPASLTTTTTQNPALAPDVNNDGAVTAMDALVVINQMNSTSSVSGEQPVKSPLASFFYPDVNGDGTVSALDALNVINYLSRHTIFVFPSGEWSASPLGSTRTTESLDALDVLHTNVVAKPLTAKVSGRSDSLKGIQLEFQSLDRDDHGDEGDTLDLLASDILSLKPFPTR